MRILIIGSGVGGLGAACLLAKAGHKVTILEKNSDLGGRAGEFSEKGFTFPYGPTWFLMAEVYERFFKELSEDFHKHIKIKELSPYFRVFFKDTLLQPVDVTGNLQTDIEKFEMLEPNSKDKLAAYLEFAKKSYEISFKHFIYSNYDSKKALSGNLSEVAAVDPLGSMHARLSRHFLSNQMRQILGYPAVFVGSSPYKTPAVYSMLNHAIFQKGVFLPEGGMHAIVKSLIKIAENNDVTFKTNSAVRKISVRQGAAKGVLLESGESLEADIVISNAGRPYTETKLLLPSQREHSFRYWRKKSYSAGAVLLYLGIKGTLPEIAYHNLIFTSDWQKQFKDIENSNRFPDNPSIYLCNLSAHNPSVAPKGQQALCVIVPVARKIPYTESGLELFASSMIDAIGAAIKVKGLKKRVIYKKVFAGNDFENRYNAYQQSALGLSHTFRQTGPFRPKNKARKVESLYYVGADTLPGISVPMCLISAELVAERITADLKS